jgi:alcohol dehydrogenase
MASQQPAARSRRLLTAVADRYERARSPRPRMRALSLSAGGRLQWRAAPAPPPIGSRGALVHPIAIATCDMDCPLFLGRTPFLLPLHLGHECVAEVVEVGEEVQNVAVGDQVLVPFQINCGVCRECRAAHTANCMRVTLGACYGFGLATGHWGGAYSDLLSVPYADAMLVALPAGVAPAAAASAADNLSDAYRHVAPHLPAILERQADARVVVVGAVNRRSLYSSSIALYAGLIARAMGAREVWLADSRPHIRRHAEQLGLCGVEPSRLHRSPPAPLVIDVSVSRRGLALALAATAPAGICTSTGNLHWRSAVPSSLMYLRNITLTGGRPHVRAIVPDLLADIASGRLNPELITTVTGTLDDAPSLLGEHFASQGVKAVLLAH